MSSIALKFKLSFSVGIEGGNFLSSMGFVASVAGLIGWLEAWVLSFSLWTDASFVVCCGFGADCVSLLAYSYVGTLIYALAYSSFCSIWLSASWKTCAPLKEKLIIEFFGAMLNLHFVQEFLLGMEDRECLLVVYLLLLCFCSSFWSFLVHV